MGVDLDRRRATILAVRSGISRFQPGPGDAPGEALVIEPRRVTVEAGRQDLRLPGAGGRLETFQLRDDLIEGIGPLHARLGRDALPVERTA